VCVCACVRVCVWRVCIGSVCVHWLHAVSVVLPCHSWRAREWIVECILCLPIMLCLTVCWHPCVSAVAMPADGASWDEMATVFALDSIRWQ